MIGRSPGGLPPGGARRPGVGSPWLLCPRPEPRAALRLFCLPHAGGDTWMYRDWPQVLSPTVEVCAIRLPGRGSRIAEPPFTDMEALVEAVAAGLGDALDRPFAIFGHSMGALVGFELARRLRRDRGATPAMFCAAACRAPHLAHFRPAISQLPPHLLIDAMRRRYGTGGGLADNPDLMQLMLPIMRADFAMCETYRYVPDDPLPCPIAVYGGTEDATMDASALDAWSDETTDAFQRHAVVGDHFFPVSARQDLLDVLARDLAWAMS